MRLSYVIHNQKFFQMFINNFKTDELIKGQQFSKILKSIFITGTDTDVGKTYITAGLAITLRKMGTDVGVMKPFAAGVKQKKGFKSEDVEILANSAKVDDSEELLNPQFFQISS